MLMYVYDITVVVDNMMDSNINNKVVVFRTWSWSNRVLALVLGQGVDVAFDVHSRNQPIS